MNPQTEGQRGRPKLPPRVPPASLPPSCLTEKSESESESASAGGGGGGVAGLERTQVGSPAEAGPDWFARQLSNLVVVIRVWKRPQA